MAATANAAQRIDGVLWMLMYTATEGAGRVQGIRGHFGGPACFEAAYLPGADHDPASPTRTAPAGIRPSTAQHPTPCGSDRWFPFAGSLASTGFMYGMTGEATFNVARLGWDGGVGVLEMSVGKNGFSSRLGMGGMDISLGTLASVGRGFTESERILSAKRSNWAGDNTAISTLNAVNMLGWTSVGENGITDNGVLARAIWDKELEVVYGAMDGYGFYNHNTPGTINLSESLKGNGREQAAKLATAMSHEGSHWAGNRVEGVAHAQGLATYTTLISRFKLNGDNKFTGEMVRGVTDVANWIENTGDQDNWSLTRKEDGSMGWAWDDSLDFNIEGVGTLTAENMQKFIATMKHISSSPLLAQLLINPVQKQDPSFENASVGISGQKQNSFMDSLFTRYVENDPERVKTVDAFLEGTRAFADASVFAKQLMNDLSIQGGIENLNSALLRAQNSGLLIENTYSMETRGLIGSGTTNNPYFPLTAFGDGKVFITGLHGFRLVDSDMVAIDNRNGTTNYPENSFARNMHNGWDGVGSGGIVASENGSFYLSYNSAAGLTTNLVGEKSYQVGHASVSSILNYFSIFSQANTTLSFSAGSYQLDGVIAGTLIGIQGNTGSASTAPHGHMTVNGSGSDFGKIFNHNSYSSSFVFTDYAKYMTGYSSRDFNSYQLWANVYRYSSLFPTQLHFNNFFYRNSPTQIRN